MGSENRKLISYEEKVFILSLLDDFFYERFGVSAKFLPELFFEEDTLKERIVIHAETLNEVGNIQSQLYLRFGYLSLDPDAKKEIVIAKILFQDEKSGHGTALLRKLSLIPEKYGYEVVSFECPNDKCRAFAKKMGFSSCKISTKDLVTSSSL